MLRELLTNLGWRTTLDIVLVGALFYQIIAMLKGTRAAQVLIGMLVIFLAYVISSVLELETLNWIISKFYSSFIFVVIVLFQDDIRRLLTRFGRGPFVSGLDENSGLRVIDEVVNAAKYLSHDRIGALIVFERGIGLERLYDHAVRVEALVSEQLLICIFQSFSPLHDGAVIVQKNRLSCASAQLPLSKNPTFSKKLGTRHSAAVGIAEETDAVVLVVSEETGNVSIAWDGQLQKQGNIDTVRRTLISLLMPQVDRSRGRRLAAMRFVHVWERVKEVLTPQPVPTTVPPVSAAKKARVRDKESELADVRATEFENRLAAIGPPHASLELRFPRYARVRAAKADASGLVFTESAGTSGATNGTFATGAGPAGGERTAERKAVVIRRGEDDDVAVAAVALSSEGVSSNDEDGDELGVSAYGQNKAAQALTHLSAEDRFVPPLAPPSPPPRGVSIGGVSLNPPMDVTDTKRVKDPGGLKEAKETKEAHTPKAPKAPNEPKGGL